MSVTLGTTQNPVKAEQNQRYERPSKTIVVNKNSSKSVIFEENNITVNHTRKTYYHRLKISVNNEQELFNISEAEKQYNYNISDYKFLINPINNNTRVENFNNITGIEVKVFSNKLIVYKGQMLRGEKIRINKTVFKLGLREDSITPSIMISKIVNDHLETQTIEEVDFGEPIKYQNKTIMITTYDDPTGYAIIKTNNKPDNLKGPTRKPITSEETSTNKQSLKNNSILEELNMTEKELGNTIKTIYRNYPKIAINLENTNKFNEYIEKSSTNIEELHQVIGQTNKTDLSKIKNITKLQTTLKNREEQIKKLKKLNNKLETQLNITKANIKKLKQRIKELEQKNQELKQKIQELKQKPLNNLKTIGNTIIGFSPFIVLGEGLIITLLLGILLPRAVNKKIEQRHKNMIQLKNHLTQLGIDKQMNKNLIDEDLTGKTLEIIKVTYKEMKGTDKITRENIKNLNIQKFAKTLNKKWKGLNKPIKKKIIKKILKLQAKDRKSVV